MKPARTWVTSDWHLYHARIIESCERPAGFESLILDAHRAVMRSQDMLINLGDVIFYQLPKLAEHMATIPGRHVLVMGNHDRKTRGWYMRHGFMFAADSIQWGDVLFTHKPVKELPEGVKWNVHGHLHRHREYEVKRDWHRLVAMEDTGYRPVLLDSLIHGEQKGGQHA